MPKRRVTGGRQRRHNTVGKAVPGATPSASTGTTKITVKPAGGRTKITVKPAGGRRPPKTGDKRGPGKGVAGGRGGSRRRPSAAQRSAPVGTIGPKGHVKLGAGMRKKVKAGKVNRTAAVKQALGKGPGGKTQRQRRKTFRGGRKSGIGGAAAVQASKPVGKGKRTPKAGAKSRTKKRRRRY